MYNPTDSLWELISGVVLVVDISFNSFSVLTQWPVITMFLIHFVSN